MGWPSGPARQTLLTLLRNAGWINIPKQFLGSDSRPGGVPREKMETAVAFGRNRSSFLLLLTTRVQTGKRKADYRAFSRRVSKDHTPLGRPWRGVGGSAGLQTPGTYFKIHVCVVRQGDV